MGWRKFIGLADKVQEEVVEEDKKLNQGSEAKVGTKGQPLYVNPPFTSRERLIRAETRLNDCIQKLSTFKKGDVKRESWEAEARRMEVLIQRFKEKN